MGEVGCGNRFTTVPEHFCLATKDNKTLRRGYKLKNEAKAVILKEQEQYRAELFASGGCVGTLS
jgi:hypothetical protein